MAVKEEREEGATYESTAERRESKGNLRCDKKDKAGRTVLRWQHGDGNSGRVEKEE